MTQIPLTTQGANAKLVSPELPSILRYYDEFLDKYIALRDLNESDTWEIYVAGASTLLDFSGFFPELRLFIKTWCADQLQTRAPATVFIRLQSLQDVAYEDLISILVSIPEDIRSLWKLMLAKGYNRFQLNSLKSILHYLCRLNQSSWSSDYSGLVQLLPLPYHDKYACVRTGDVFLSIDEESALVEHFDTLSQRISDDAVSVSDVELRDATILVCSFQFGLRPTQISRIQMRDVRIWVTDGDDFQSVHLTFKMAKQRSSSKSLPMTRKVKREWSPLFVEIYRRAKLNGLEGTDRLFNVDSSRTTASIIIKKTGELLPESRSATELRHTAAQRLVDAGANKEELAEFMGHSDTETGLVYFQTSANQAERVNQALSVSSIYQMV